MSYTIIRGIGTGPASVLFRDVCPIESQIPPFCAHMRRSKKLVVVGNGMVGFKLCEKLRKRVGGDELEITVYGEEPRPAYDRVHLSSYFSGQTPEDLLMAPRSWYEEHEITLHTSEHVEWIDRSAKRVGTKSGATSEYDELVLATGSSPFVPDVAGSNIPGVFVYRTIEDLKAIDDYGSLCARGVVLGGGLLGLEAAKALLDLELDTTVVEFMPRLMPRQLDDGAALVLRDRLESLGLSVLTGKETVEICGQDEITDLRFSDDSMLATDILVISAGIRPRDELARKCGLAVGRRGGIVVNDRLKTIDDSIYAIGEAALHDGIVYGLVAPGYAMAEVVASQIVGNETAVFSGFDTATKLKLIGVDVASFGDPFDGDGSVPIVYNDRLKGIYKKINVAKDGSRLLGGVLVGDMSSHGLLQQMYLNGSPCSDNPADLILGPRGGGSADGAAGMGLEFLPLESQVCSCENVTRGTIEQAVLDHDLTEVTDVARSTGAGTGCGGCKPLVSDLLVHLMKASGKEVSRSLCEHFDYTRQELYDLIKVRNVKSFDELLEGYGTGDGCEICQPAVASLMASIFAELATSQPTIQDTNDRFLANIQRGGTYSVIPRVPGGEITPAKLSTIARVAEEYGLYTKITGGQRIDLFGARVEQLPTIWEELIDAGFESGHAYGKALRTVKSCVGTSWCRYGVQDAVSFAIKIEERYKGIRAPHKIKSAVSGCTRECAEAQSKDFGLIATEKGWNLYVGGNGGSNPQHAKLLESDLDEETCIKLIDRFLMFYIKTAAPLTRTAKWLNKLEGGLEYLRDVIVRDSLGICAELERDMEELVGNYECEWRTVVESPELRKRFSHFVNVDEPDPTLEFVPMRGQEIPAPWPA